jgi:chaperonin cofactor prefoldin
MPMAAIPKFPSKHDIYDLEGAIKLLVDRLDRVETDNLDNTVENLSDKVEALDNTIDNLAERIKELCSAFDGLHDTLKEISGKMKNK